MGLLDLIDKYGGIFGLVVFIVITFLIPVLRDRLIPAMLKQREAEYAAALRLTREDTDFRREIERERLASAKRTDESIVALAGAMTLQAERMTTILANQSAIMARQDDILAVLQDGIAAMRERVSERKGYERGKKEHKAGDTGPLDAQP